MEKLFDLQVDLIILSILFIISIFSYNDVYVLCTFIMVMVYIIRCIIMEYKIYKGWYK